jgi:hypothetical protein
VIVDTGRERVVDHCYELKRTRDGWNTRRLEDSLERDIKNDYRSQLAEQDGRANRSEPISFVSSSTSRAAHSDGSP